MPHSNIELTSVNQHDVTDENTVQSIRFDDFFKYNPDMRQRSDPSMPYVLFLDDYEEERGSDWFDRDAPQFIKYEAPALNETQTKDCDVYFAQMSMWEDIASENVPDRV